jgi:mannose-6-phosphate isomerase-like protein (cupin superfamily)
MQVRRANEQKVSETPGGNTTVTLLPAFESIHAVGMIRQRQQAGGKNPLHTHNCEEVMLQTAGRVSVMVGEQQVELRAGDVLVIPADTLHQIENTGSEEAEWLLIWPAGARFFSAEGEEMQPVWAHA